MEFDPKLAIIVFGVLMLLVFKDCCPIIVKALIFIVLVGFYFILHFNLFNISNLLSKFFNPNTPIPIT